METLLRGGLVGLLVAFWLCELPKRAHCLFVGSMMFEREHYSSHCIVTGGNCRAGGRGRPQSIQTKLVDFRSGLIRERGLLGRMNRAWGRRCLRRRSQIFAKMVLGGG